MVYEYANIDSMAMQKRNSLNQLGQLIPEGILVDAAWLTQAGYSTSLRSQYVRAGWLDQPARRVYCRPRGELTWEQVVISLQTMLRHDLAVGGLTALRLHGFAHYVTQTPPVVHLYGPKPPPAWLEALHVNATFAFRNDARLFRKERVSTAPHSLDPESAPDPARPESIVALPWGQWNWPIMISSPERAILELLDELPDDESFHQVDRLMEGLSTLSPSRLQTLLDDCRNVKVTRLFFFFAERHNHAWLKRLDRSRINFGAGKRMLVRGGRYDARHLITVPRDLDGIQ